MIRIAESTTQVKLTLHLTGISVITAVFVHPEGGPEEIGAHVFDRIQTKTVRFRPVHQPAGRAVEIVFDILLINRGIVLQILLRAGFNLRLIRRGISAINQQLFGQGKQSAKPHIIPVFVIGIVFRTLQIPDKFDFLSGTAFTVAKVLIGRPRFLRDIN